MREDGEQENLEALTGASTYHNIERNHTELNILLVQLIVISAESCLLHP